MNSLKWLTAVLITFMSLDKFDRVCVGVRKLNKNKTVNLYLVFKISKKVNLWKIACGTVASRLLG